MANEAIKRYAPSSQGDVIQDFSVSDNYALEKGAFVQLLDARAVSGTITAGCACAGIVAREKIAGDGRTQVAVYREGDFDVVGSGTIAIGAPLVLEGTFNYVKSALVGGATGASGAAVIGYALEAASGDEVFQMRLKL